MAMKHTLLEDGTVAIWEGTKAIWFHPKDRMGRESSKFCLFTKEIPFEEAEWYWVLDNRDDGYKIYHQSIKGRRLCMQGPGHITPKDVVRLYAIKELSVKDARLIEEYQREHFRPVGERTQIAGVRFSELFDGQSILSLMKVKPKMSYRELMMVIENEHGSVDACGIIHKAG